jgi:hypothetical protein
MLDQFGRGADRGRWLRHPLTLLFFGGARHRRPRRSNNRARYTSCRI